MVNGDLRSNAKRENPASSLCTFRSGLRYECVRKEEEQNYVVLLCCWQLIGGDIFKFTGAKKMKMTQSYIIIENRRGRFSPSRRGIGIVTSAMQSMENANKEMATMSHVLRD